MRRVHWSALGLWTVAMLGCGIRGTPRPAPAPPVMPSPIESQGGVSGRDSLSRSPFAPVQGPDAGVDPDPLNPRSW